MASNSGELGRVAKSAIKTFEPRKGPLIRERSSFSSNRKLFSMDRTFSASSTDIHETFDVFDEGYLVDDDETTVNVRTAVCDGSRGQTLSGGKLPSPLGHLGGMRGIEDGKLVSVNSRLITSNPQCNSNKDTVGARVPPDGDDDGSSEDEEGGGGDRNYPEFNRHETFLDDEEFSTGLPSDLPSGMVDIEGNIIGDIDNVRFGQEEDDLCSLDGINNMGESYKRSNGSNDQNNCQHPSGNRGLVGKRSALQNHSHGHLPSSSIISDGKMGAINNNFNSSSTFATANNYNNSNSSFGNNMKKENFQRYTRGPYAPLDRCNSTSASSNNSRTITQHYYPEGGWGFVVLVMALLCHVLLVGVHLCSGIIAVEVLARFGSELRMEAVWICSFSVGLSWFLSPIWVSICKRKSTRLSAVFGGLVASLGCLFTSFTSQFHQLIFSYSILMSVGIGLTRDASFLMVGQYFKRKRDTVEIVVVSGSGLGILIMSVCIQFCISSVGWRLGLQAVTGSLFLTFFLGTCYRSASLYHPQRRAILHLKNQKRKIKEKEKRTDRPPFIDFACLRSRSLQIILFSSSITSCGIFAPLFHLAFECIDAEFENSASIFLHIYLGTAWLLGCCLFGLISIQKNEDCRISKQYLCQAAGITCGISMLALTTVKEYGGLVIFVWVYGFALGGYQYILKTFTYEKLRARNFPRAWSFIQCSQGVPFVIGAAVTGYMNSYVGFRAGYYFSAVVVFVGSAVLFLTNVRRRRLFRDKSRNSSMKTCETIDSLQSPPLRRISFAFPDEPISPIISKDGRSGGSDKMRNSNISNQEQPMVPKELTCISEEGVLDTDYHATHMVPYTAKWNNFFNSRGLKSNIPEKKESF